MQAPVDVMFAALLNKPGVRAMPRLCTAEQERGANAAEADCGARLWQTHATAFPEDAAKAPELATAPTRRIVSHAGVDATEQETLPAALAKADGGYLLQHLVVSVDQPDSFDLVAADLYPAPVGLGDTTSAGSVLFWREATDGGRSCVPGADAVVSGCVNMVEVANGSTELFDVSTAAHRCSQAPSMPNKLPSGANCLHSVGLWQAWSVARSTANGGGVVVLGDLTRYVSLSGYRFRLPPSTKTIGSDRSTGEVDGSKLIVVGMPDELVPITYLVKNTAGKWIVKSQNCTVGSTGRTLVELA